MSEEEVCQPGMCFAGRWIPIQQMHVVGGELAYSPNVTQKCIISLDYKINVHLYSGERLGTIPLVRMHRKNIRTLARIVMPLEKKKNMSICTFRSFVALEI